MNPARTELIEKVKALLGAWMRAEEVSNSNFSGELTPVLASHAYATDPLYRATMHLADAFADAYWHGFDRVDDMEFGHAAELLRIGLRGMESGETSGPSRLMGYG